MKYTIKLENVDEPYTVEGVNPLTAVIELLNRLGLNYRNEKFKFVEPKKQQKLKAVA